MPSPIKKQIKSSFRRKEARPVKELSFDFPLLFTSMGLLLFGLIFMYSSSAFWGAYYKKDAFYFFKRQLAFAAVGFAAMMWLAKYFSRIREKIDTVKLMWATWIILAVTLGMHASANVHRWISIGPVHIQPSEIAKVTLLLYISSYIDSHKSQIAKSWQALIAPLLFSGITFALIGLEPDLGTPVLLFTVLMLVLYVAGARIKYIMFCGLAAVPLVVYEVFHYQYRLKRMLVFLSPESQASAAGYQLSQAFIAVGSGGWLGAGLGASKMKMLYLPAPHTDFIFAVMAEELGLLRTLVIIGAFCYILIRGLKIARAAQPLANQMLALGITLTIVLQAFLNMAMALGVIPTKGLPLPFFSYGGSSIISTLVMIGILLNISARETTLRPVSGDAGGK